MSTKSHEGLEGWGLFIVTFAIFLAGANTLPIAGFESRFYYFAEQMWQYGGSFFPTTYGYYYPDYPATYTFLIILSATLLGGMSRLSAILPSALAASITVVMTYWIGALQNKKWGLCAVCLLLMTVTFFQSARTLSLDMLITMITTTCFYIVYSADIKDKHDRVKFIYLLFIFGFLLRGPIGLIIPAAVVMMYYLQDGNFRRFFFSGVATFIILLICTFILLRIAENLGGHEFAHAVLSKEVFGRMSVSHVPAYFYFTAGLKDYALSFPIALLVMLGVIYYEQCLQEPTPTLKLLLKCIGWVAIILIGMSIPGEKKIRYLVPLTPALALLASSPFVAPQVERYFYFLRWVLLRLFLLFPIFLYIGLRFVMHYSVIHALTLPVDYAFMTKLFFVLLALSFVIYIILHNKQDMRDIGILFIATVAFIASYLFVVLPIEKSLNYTSVFVSEIEKARAANHAALVFYDAPPDGWPIKYLVHAPMNTKPVFIRDENELYAYHHKAYFVTAQPIPVSSMFHVIAHGNIEQKPVVVFEN